MISHSEFSVEEKGVGEQLVLATRWHGSYEDTGKALSRLYKIAGRQAGGAPYNLYHDGEYKDGDADIETCLPVRKFIEADGYECKVMDPWTCLSLIHKGPYDDLGLSYQKIFDCLKQLDKKVLLPFREVYLKGPGMLLKGNPKNYLTEIQVRIDP